MLEYNSTEELEMRELGYFGWLSIEKKITLGDTKIVLTL